MEYSMQIAKWVKQFLDEDDWHYEFNEEKGVFNFNLTLKGKLQSIRYRILIRKYDYSVYTVCPMSAEDCLPQMAEFLCRANYGLANGNFELDFRDGEIRYKCFVTCDETVPGKETIKDSIYAPARMFTRYSEGILAVLFNMKSAEQAVKDCESAD